MLYVGGLLLQSIVDPYAEYKIIGVIMAVLAVVAGAAWKVYQAVSDRLEKAREKEILADKDRREKEIAIDRERREWTSNEASKSREHLSRITQDFKEALYQMETRRDQNGETQSEALNKLAESMSKLAQDMGAHNQTVNEQVVKRLERIEQNTQPRNQTNPGKGSSRGAG
jgi:DNA anti-recombination protein RmuC